MKKMNKNNQFKNRISNKKAATPSQILIDFWATLVIVIILAIFFFILYISQDNREIAIKAQAAEFEVNDELLHLLQYPVIIDGKTMSFSEAIAVSVQKDDFTELEQAFVKVKSLIQTRLYFQSNGCIEINIEYSGGKRTIPATINCEEYSKYERSTEKIYKSKVEIPSFEGERISVTYSASKITNEVKRKYES